MPGRIFSDTQDRPRRQRPSHVPYIEEPPGPPLNVGDRENPATYSIRPESQDHNGSPSDSSSNVPGPWSVVSYRPSASPSGRPSSPTAPYPQYGLPDMCFFDVYSAPIQGEIRRDVWVRHMMDDNVVTGSSHPGLSGSILRLFQM
ncbi:uncharacterized protein L203_102824 [Cryptococcus depauperatus CBS 7841]|uniref:Uncharacterized protein n=1 Tax=Cryptococcus depauperatus CBS 7841 TaxID=1295531 RepID=A0AAJ8JSP4_9TREE